MKYLSSKYQCSVPSNDAKSIRIGSQPPTTNPSINTSLEGQKHLAIEHPASPAGIQLLDALWRSPDRCHQIGILDQQTGRFKNIPVKDIANAISLAHKHSSEGAEVYFACAEYQSSISRTVANVSGACGFWLDIDCGEDKAADDKGYATVKGAGDALSKFCDEAGLPKPTHVVHSGGGIHAYWILDREVVRDEWQSHAKKLKALTKACRFKADDTRTADIASVMRIPGTFNYKSSPPKPVTLQLASAEHIGHTFMLDAITAAHAKRCGTVANKPSGRHSIAPTITNINGRKDANVPPDLVRLESALASLDPDCDEPTWKLRRLAPIADAARHYPHYDAELYDLARSWSSGELGCCTSIKWGTPGGNGRTGAEVFDEIWLRFLTSNYPGVPTTLGTVYYDAILAGWDPDDQFQIIDSAAEEGA